MTDMINHPPHYAAHPVFTGEAYDLCQYCDFTTGNAIKYCWRAGAKDSTLQDLQKSQWYLDRLPAPNISIIPANLVAKVEQEATEWLYDHDTNIRWCTVAAILHIVRGNHDTARELVNKAIGIAQDEDDLARCKANHPSNWRRRD